MRFDEENTLCGCSIPCHRYLDTHKTEFQAFMIKRLGQKGYDLLEFRKNLYKKRDDKADLIILKELLKQETGALIE